jgi:hypothetical protein
MYLAPIYINILLYIIKMDINTIIYNFIDGELIIKKEDKEKYGKKLIEIIENLIKSEYTVIIYNDIKKIFEKHNDNIKEYLETLEDLYLKKLHNLLQQILINTIDNIDKKNISSDNNYLLNIIYTNISNKEYKSLKLDNNKKIYAFYNDNKIYNDNFKFKEYYDNFIKILLTLTYINKNLLNFYNISKIEKKKKELEINIKHILTTKKDTHLLFNLINDYILILDKISIIQDIINILTEITPTTNKDSY